MRARVVTFLILFSLLLPAAAQRDFGEGRAHAEFGRKISPALIEALQGFQGTARESQLPVIIRVTADSFQAMEARRPEPSPGALPVIHSYSARLSPTEIQLLAASSSVEYVTVDPELRVAGGPRGGSGSRGVSDSQLITIGADQAHALGLDGSNVGIAVFDSGVRDHPDLSSRTAAAVDFTSGTAVEDNTKRSSGLDFYGHGTHVAGIAAGEGKKSGGAVAGVAPQADIIDIKVIDDDGSGRTSHLIAAIDWVISQKHRYGIRVANLSLGHPVVESYVDDPLCQAVRRLVEAGIVTVVSSGNLGRGPEGEKVWESISSPGNEPSVITVGALNSLGTVTHQDDLATSYGSRGPTYLDGLFKPDLVAPGNQIASLLAKSSVLHNDYPDLQLDDYYVYLSGSSMAAPYVAGTVALMLQANPELTPRQVKALLLLSAIKLENLNILEQGNGLVNTLTAVELARALDVENRTFVRDVPPFWTLDGQRVWAGGAIAFGQNLVLGGLTQQGSHQIWGDGAIWSDGMVWTDGMFWADGVIWADGMLWSDSYALSDSELWTDGVFWSDQVESDFGIRWTDQALPTDALLGSGLTWTDGMLWSDATQSHDFRGDR